VFRQALVDFICSFPVYCFYSNIGFYLFHAGCSVLTFKLLKLYFLCVFTTCQLRMEDARLGETMGSIMFSSLHVWRLRLDFILLRMELRRMYFSYDNLQGLKYMKDQYCFRLEIVKIAIIYVMIGSLPINGGMAELVMAPG
jgi:hypothetical protein